MWVVAQNRKRVYKITNAWINDVKENGDCEICIGYGFGAEDEFWDKVGTYKEERAKQIFEQIISNIGHIKRFEMPKE